MKKQAMIYHLLLIISCILPLNLCAKNIKTNCVIKEISNLQELEANLPAIIEFYSNDCGACKMFKKKFEELSKKYTNINFLKIDGVKYPKLLKIYAQEVTAFPSFALVLNSKIKNPKIIIGGNKYKIEKAIEELVNQIKHPNLIEVDSFQSFQDIANNKSDKLIVATYHSAWCSHCKSFAPQLLDLSDNYKDAIFIKLDKDAGDNEKFAKKYLGQNYGFPSTCIFKDKNLEKPVAIVVGTDKDGLNAAILQSTQPASATDVIHIQSKAQLDDLIKNSKVPVIIDFHNERSCGPCRMYKDIFTGYAINHPNLKFAKVDVSLSIDGDYKIESIPTTIFFENGAPTQRFSGVDPRIKTALQKLNKK